MHLSGFQIIWQPSSDWLQPPVWGWQMLSYACRQPCAAYKGHARSDDLESLKGGLLYEVGGPRRLKKRANGPSCGVRNKKQCERL